MSDNLTRAVARFYATPLLVAGGTAGCWGEGKFCDGSAALGVVESGVALRLPAAIQDAIATG